MVPENIKNKTILYAALDWGYGHVTRSIGIINELKESNTILIACNSDQKKIFFSYFPELNYIDLEGYNLKFKGNGKWALDLLFQGRKFLKSIKRENKFVDKLTNIQEIDLLISDHRYGFYSKNIPSIFVTHQLHLPLTKPKAIKWKGFIQNWHEKQIRKFSSVWVLDDEKSSLAGKLSKAIKHSNLHYIGWKSRFEDKNCVNIMYDYLVVISGPKPYSNIFHDEIVRNFNFAGKKVAIIYPPDLHLTKISGMEYFPSENLKDLDFLFYESETILSRSGYSTIMDVKILNKKAIYFPTKGQKEQEYLAEIHK